MIELVPHRQRMYFIGLAALHRARNFGLCWSQGRKTQNRD